MTHFGRDLRVAARGLRKNPGFATVATLTLAPGIGATTAIFSVVDAVLLRPLPYADPGRLVRIWSAWEGSERANVSPAEYFDYRDRLRGFEETGAFAGDAANLTGAGDPERLSVAYVSASLFPVLGVEPALGRTFTAEEDRPGGEASVVLGDGLWRRAFGASPDVVGRRIVLDREPHTVVGVMPPGFRLPEDFGAAQPSALWLPLGIDRTTIPNRGSHFLGVVGRLRPGADPAAGAAAARAVAAQFVREFPDDYPPGMGFSATAVPLGEDIVGAARSALLVLLGAVAFVLLIACANVANLLLARGEDRAREMALRAALGAGRGDIVRQLLAESIVLAALGGTLGLLLALWGVDVLPALAPGDLPRLEEVGADARVLAFAAAASVMTALAFGLAPALRASRPDVVGWLKEGGRGTTGGPRGRGFRRGVVIAEVALALMLLVGAGLLARSLLRLQRVDPGFRTDRVLTVPLTLPASAYPEETDVTAFFRAVVERVSTLPGVARAGAVTGLPLAGERGDLNLLIEGRPESEGESSPAADWQVVTPGYFDAIGMHLLRGRGIEPSDDERAPGAVVINRTMARLLWPGEDPIGARFTLGGGAGPGTVTVVGIVEDVRHAGLDRPPRSEMYLPHAQFRFWDSGDAVTGMTLAIRTAGDPDALAAAVRREVRALDPDLPVGGFRTIAQVVADSVSRPRFTALMLAIFSAVALALAAVGIYGVLSHAAARRTHEIGVRVALGAGRSDVLRLMLGQTLALAGVGVALGVAGALALTRVLRSQLYGVSPTDPLTFGATAVLVTAVALAATWVPARRALRVDPMTALRVE